MSFGIKDDYVLNKCNEIWDKTIEMLKIKFFTMPVYDEKYIAKVKEFDGAIKKNFSGDRIPEENEHYACIACIVIDSVMKIEKKNYPHIYLEECKYRMKKEKMTKFTEAELKLESEPKSELEFDTE